MWGCAARSWRRHGARKYGSMPEVSRYVHALQVSGDLRDLRMARAAWYALQARRLTDGPSEEAVAAMVRALCRSGKVSDAFSFLERIHPDREVPSVEVARALLVDGAAQLDHETVAALWNIVWSGNSESIDEECVAAILEMGHPLHFVQLLYQTIQLKEQNFSVRLLSQFVRHFCMHEAADDAIRCFEIFIERLQWIEQPDEIYDSRLVADAVDIPLQVAIASLVEMFIRTGGDWRHLLEQTLPILSSRKCKVSIELFDRAILSSFIYNLPMSDVDLLFIGPLFSLSEKPPALQFFETLAGDVLAWLNSTICNDTDQWTDRLASLRHLILQFADSARIRNLLLSCYSRVPGSWNEAIEDAIALSACRAFTVESAANLLRTSVCPLDVSQTFSRLSTVYNCVLAMDHNRNILSEPSLSNILEDWVEQRGLPSLVELFKGVRRRWKTDNAGKSLLLAQLHMCIEKKAHFHRVERLLSFRYIARVLSEGSTVSTRYDIRLQNAFIALICVLPAGSDLGTLLDLLSAWIAHQPISLPGAHGRQMMALKLGRQLTLASLDRLVDGDSYVRTLQILHLLLSQSDLLA